MILAVINEFFLKDWIRQVGAVPGQHVSDAVQYRQCEMGGISLGLCRDFQKMNQILREGIGFVGDVQVWNGVKI